MQTQMARSRASRALVTLGRDQKYEKMSDLSSGAYGFVQLARNTHTHQLVAIKFLERGDRIDRYIEGEILNHHALNHPHIIEFKEVFLTRDHICIVEEFASAGSLFSYVHQNGRLREGAARWFFQQLIIAIDYCHQKGVVNRDIKLENTLLHCRPGLPLPLVKICDFGFSKAISMSAAPQSRVGTLAYMAPEVIQGAGSYDGKKADIWSCGVMLFIMLYGQYPFQPELAGTNHAAHLQAMLSRINNPDLVYPAHIPITESAQGLLKKLLVADPEQRLSTEEIFQHPWFTTHLPPTALEMNDKLLDAQPEDRQPLGEVRAVLEAAQQPSGCRYGGGVSSSFDSLDEMIDGTMKSEGGFML